MLDPGVKKQLRIGLIFILITLVGSLLFGPEKVLGGWLLIGIIIVVVWAFLTLWTGFFRR